MQRPDRLYVEWSGDLGDRRFWYDGKSITLYNPATPFYATPAPADIDAMLDKVVTQLDFSPPLADLLYATRMRCTRNVQYGFDLGMTDMNGRSCHALAFVEKDIDWQIWIDAGPATDTVQLVITYKTQPSQPQFARCSPTGTSHHGLPRRCSRRPAGGRGENSVRDCVCGEMKIVEAHS